MPNYFAYSHEHYVLNSQSLATCYFSLLYVVNGAYFLLLGVSLAEGKNDRM